MRYHRMLMVPSSPAAPGVPPLHEAKRGMRTRLIALRDALPVAQRTQASLAIAASIATLPEYRSAGVVALTASVKSEWETRPLILDAFAAGKRVVLPRVDPTRRMLELRAIERLEDLVPGYLGLLEPSPDAPLVDARTVDWVLVPGVAFDPAGRRLGYGGGFYDRLQSTLAARSRVAGAFDLQIVDEVPAAPYDRGVDVIVTETRTLTAGSAGP